MVDLAEKLYNLKIECSKEVSWILEEMLAVVELFPTIWEDADKDYACQNLYFETAAEADEKCSWLIDYVNDQKEVWGIAGDYSITVEEIAKEDWSEVWKKFFHTRRVTDRFVIKPSWEEYDAEPGEVILEIDPGMSFGTGQHGTTQACLQFIDSLCAKGKINSMLDAGTGSGILSMGAAKLGISQISAFDYDPDAVRIAGENLELAGVADKVKLSVADVADWPTDIQYDLVIANILCVVLIKNAKVLASVVKTGGTLILAGILDSQYQELHDTFSALGLKEIENTQIKEWKSGLFIKE